MATRSAVAPPGSALEMTSNQFIDKMGHIDKNSFSNDTERSKARLAAMALLSRLETPWEVAGMVSVDETLLRE